MDERTFYRFCCNGSFVFPATTDFERKKKKKNKLQLFWYLKREGRVGQSKKKREEFNLVGFFYIYYEGRRRRLRRHGRRSASRERAAISTLGVATPVRDAVEWQCSAAQPGATQAYLNSRLDYSSDLDTWGDSISYWFGVGVGLDTQMGIRTPSVTPRNFEISGRTDRTSESVSLLKKRELVRLKKRL